MNTRRKSTLFLTEQLIVIAVFALCAIACISILTTSYFMVQDSRNISMALNITQNYAEALKASGSDEASVTADVFYNGNWLPVDDISKAAFILKVTTDTQMEDLKLISYEIIVDKVTGENIMTLPVTIREK